MRKHKLIHTNEISNSFKSEEIINDQFENDDFYFKENIDLNVKNHEEKTDENLEANYLNIFHNDHFDFLINGYLYYYKPGGGIQIHELEASQVNPVSCHKLEEVSHLKNIEQLEKIYETILLRHPGKLTADDLYGNTCHSFNCNCENSDWKNLEKSQSFLENLSKAETQNETISLSFLSSSNEEENEKHTCCKKICLDENHKCFCKETNQFKHIHGNNCGHQIIYHDGHLDYIVDDNLHFVHDGHCDNHGKVNIVTMNAK